MHLGDSLIHNYYYELRDNNRLVMLVSGYRNSHLSGSTSNKDLYKKYDPVPMLTRHSLWGL